MWEKIGDKNLLDGVVIKLRWFVAILIIAVVGVVVSNATGSARVNHASTKTTSQSLSRQYQKRLARLRAHLARASKADVAAAPHHTDTCFAASEEIAHKKILEDLRQKEPVELENFMLGFFMCADGLSEEEAALLESEINARLHETTLFRLKAIEVDQNDRQETAHAIIRRHLGEDRYNEQVARCKADETKTSSETTRNQANYMATILQLSPDQRSAFVALAEEYEALMSSRPSYPPNDAEDTIAPEIQEREEIIQQESRAISERLFAILTPDQARQYRDIWHNEGNTHGDIVILFGKSIAPPEAW